MLRALRAIGELVGGPVLYDFCLEKKVEYVFILEFDEQGRYRGISVERFDRKKIPLYFFRKGTGKPYNTPTCYLDKKIDKETKKIDKKRLAKSVDHLRKAYKGLKESYKKSAKQKLRDLNLEDEEVCKRIVEDVQNRLEEMEIPLKTGVLLTIKIDGKWLGEIEDVQKALFFLIRGKEGREARKGICAVCGEEKLVRGDTFPLKFYTVDKPGFAADFDKKMACKGFPLCCECHELIRTGLQHVKTNLQFFFVTNESSQKKSKGKKKTGAIDYLLIPDFIWGKEHVRKEVWELLTEEREQWSSRLHSLNCREKARIADDEEEILDLLSKERDVMTFHFLFLLKNQNQEILELYVQDVYPSRLRALFDAKECIERVVDDLKRRQPGKRGSNGGYEFTYGTIYQFFVDRRKNREQKNRSGLKCFYELVNATFKGSSFNERILLFYLMRRIRQEVASSEQQKNLKHLDVVLDAFAAWSFVKLTTQKIKMEVKALKRENLDAFLKGLPVLDTDLKKGVFLLGSLTESLLRVQYSEKKSKPFWKTLKCLRMSYKDVQGLLPKVVNKLVEYKSFGSKEKRLFEKISDYLSREPSPYNLNVDELNFCFALGMGMFDKVRSCLTFELEQEKGQALQIRKRELEEEVE